jgi:hypothetical protein
MRRQNSITDSRYFHITHVGKQQGSGRRSLLKWTHTQQKHWQRSNLRGILGPRSSWMSRNVQGFFVVEVSVQRTSPVFKGQEVFFSVLTLWVYTVTLRCPEASVTTNQLTFQKNPKQTNTSAAWRRKPKIFHIFVSFWCPVLFFFKTLLRHLKALSVLICRMIHAPGINAWLT